MIPYILVGGAVLAAGILLSDSDESDREDFTEDNVRKVPERDVPADIRRQAKKNSRRS